MLINEKVMSRSAKRMVQSNNIIIREIENIRKYEEYIRKKPKETKVVEEELPPSFIPSSLINQFNSHTNFHEVKTLGEKDIFSYDLIKKKLNEKERLEQTRINKIRDRIKSSYFSSVSREK